jgi:hypothetical protein
MYASAALSSTNRCIQENRQHHHTTSSFSGNYVPSTALRKQRNHTTNIITLSVGMLPMLKWVFENHCYWKTERWRNLEKKNQLQQEKKKRSGELPLFLF